VKDLRIISEGASTIDVLIAHFYLCGDSTLVRGLEIPKHRLRVVLRYSSTGGIQMADFDLSIGISVVSGLELPLHNLKVVLGRHWPLSYIVPMLM